MKKILMISCLFAVGCSEQPEPAKHAAVYWNPTARQFEFQNGEPIEQLNRDMGQGKFRGRMEAF